MSTNPTLTLGRSPTPDPFPDYAIRFLRNNLFGMFGPFPYNEETRAHSEHGYEDIPELVWPGPPSPGLEPTPFDQVLMDSWGEPNGDRLLYMSGDE